MKKPTTTIIILAIFLIPFISAEIVDINPTISHPTNNIQLTITPETVGFYNIIYIYDSGDNFVDLINVPCDTICTENKVFDYTVPQNFLGDYYFATYDYDIEDYELDSFTINPLSDIVGISGLDISDTEFPTSLVVNPSQAENADITISAILNTPNCEASNLNAYLCEPIPTTANDFGEIRKITNVDETWQTINLLNTYTSPVIVCTYNLPSATDLPAVTRITNVQSNSFDLRIQTPCGTGATSGDVTCLIIEEGDYTLEDGTNFEAHTYLSQQTDENNDWTPVNIGYSQSYTNPITIGQVMSNNDAEWSSFWCSDTSRTDPPSTNFYAGKEVGEDTNIIRADETIGYIIFDSGSNNIGTLDYEAGRTSDAIQGIGNSPPYSSALTQSYSLGVAQQVAMDGGNGGWAVLFGTTPISSTINLAIEEDQCADSERSHTAEQVDYIVFSNEGILTLPPIAPSQEIKKYFGEIRKISNVGETWQTVDLLKSYAPPVIVCTYNIPSVSDLPAVTRITNVQSNSFDLKIQNPCGTGVTPGEVTCLIVEEGDYILPNGNNLEAHRYNSQQTDAKGDWTPVDIGFSQIYTNPIIIGQVMSNNDPEFSSFWCSDTSIADPPSANFYAGKQVAEDTTTIRNDEIIGYIILEQNSGDIGDLSYEAGRTSDSIQGITNSPPYTSTLSSTYSLGVAQQVAMDGNNGGWAVLFGTNPISSTINLAIEEDQCTDAERTHVNEQVDYVVFSNEGLLYVPESSGAECTSLHSTYEVPLTYSSTISPDECLFQYIGTDAMQFYKPNGDWKMSVFYTNDIFEEVDFTYNQLSAITYPASINFGTLNKLMWNTGIPSTGLDLSNAGNMPLTIDWQSSGFTCIDPPTCTDFWPTIEQGTGDPTFQIDDDTFFAEDPLDETDNLPTFILPTPNNFFPAPGLSICIADDCNNNIGEKVNTLFNLKIPSIERGTYQGDILVTLY